MQDDYYTRGLGDPCSNCGDSAFWHERCPECGALKRRILEGRKRRYWKNLITRHLALNQHPTSDPAADDY